MVSTIFQSEVSVLEAQILAARQRITLLNEAEGVTGDSLLALKTAISKVSSLAPDAIANLRAAVLNLFSGSDDSNDGGNGNQPSPTPQPSPAPEAELEPLTGQLCELTSPWYHPPADAASIELDAPDCTVSDVAQPPYVELIPVTHTTAYQRSQDGEIICAYLGGNNKSRLKDWGSWLCNQHSVGSGFELREAKRMTAYKWELKIWGMSLKQVVRLSETDTTKSVPSRYHVASFPVAAHLLQSDEDVPQGEVEQVVEDNDHIDKAKGTKLEAETDTQSFQVGDHVQITSERHGVDLLSQTGIITTATEKGAAVNVAGTMRWFCSDEVVLVEASPTARNAVDDLFPTAPTPTITPAYNPNPIGRGGAAANWRARQAAGIGVNLKDCGTGGIKTIAEWQQIEAEQKALAASTPDDEPDF